MIETRQLAEAFAARFGRAPTAVTFAPGRVNLIGEHIDYHGGPVLPMALERGISIAWAPREDGRVVAGSGNGYPEVEFEIADPGPPRLGGDWGNYLRAPAAWFVLSGDASRGAGIPTHPGVDLWIGGDLPEASGLSSSSALVVATGLTLLEAAGALGELDDARRHELATEFAAAERYVGTAGGGMDQAASIGGVTGHALRIVFDPLDWRAVPLPDDLRVVVAHSGVRAEKSGAARERYNAIRAGFADPGIAAHIRTEQERVEEAVQLLESASPDRSADLKRLGRLLDASQESLRSRLRVSHPVLEDLCHAARAAGALGARLTGAGFGGSIVALAHTSQAETVCDTLRSLQAELPNAVPAFVAKAGDGARVDPTD